jgi:hypothetical protein
LSALRKENGEQETSPFPFGCVEGGGRMPSQVEVTSRRSIAYGILQRTLLENMCETALLPCSSALCSLSLSLHVPFCTAVSPQE